jgi:hypothetical protein
VEALVLASLLADHDDVTLVLGVRKGREGSPQRFQKTR